MGAHWLLAGRDCGARGFRQTTLFVTSVANLKTARTLALDDDLAVPRAQFDLAKIDPVRERVVPPRLTQRWQPGSFRLSMYVTVLV